MTWRELSLLTRESSFEPILLDIFIDDLNIEIESMPSGFTGNNIKILLKIFSGMALKDNH